MKLRSLLRRRAVWSRLLTLTMILALASSGVPHPQTVQAQIAPVGSGFTLDAGDLRFIFHQIEVAQDHSAGLPLVGSGPNQIADVRLPLGLRTVDGSFNHLEPGQ